MNSIYIYIYIYLQLLIAKETAIATFCGLLSSKFRSGSFNPTSIMAGERPAPSGEKSAGGDMEKGGAPIPGISEDAIRSGSVVPEQVLKHSGDADEAMKAFAQYKGQVIQIDEATNKRLLRRIDMNLMPVSTVVIES